MEITQTASSPGTTSSPGGSVDNDVIGESADQDRHAARSRRATDDHESIDHESIDHESVAGGPETERGEALTPRWVSNEEWKADSGPSADGEPPSGWLFGDAAAAGSARASAAEGRLPSNAGAMPTAAALDHGEGAVIDDHEQLELNEALEAETLAASEAEIAWLAEADNNQEEVGEARTETDSLHAAVPASDRGVVWRNGSLVPFADATTHVLSHMVACGSQVLEQVAVVFQADQASAVGLRNRVARFLRAAEALGMADVGTQQQLEAAVAQAVFANRSTVSHHANNNSPLIVKLVAGWTGETLSLAPMSPRPSVWVFPLAHLGSVGLADLPRPAKARSMTCPSGASASLTGACLSDLVRPQIEAGLAGFDHLVLRSSEDLLAESPINEVVVVSDGRLVMLPAPSRQDGLGRRLIADLALAEGIEVERRQLAWDEILGADEVFLCSATRPIQTLDQIDDQKYGAPSDLLTSLSTALDVLFKGDHELGGRWLSNLNELA